MKTIKVLIDTNVIETNTKDSLAVEIENIETVTEGEVVTSLGTIKGDNITLSSKYVVYLGNFKNELLEIAGKIEALIQKRSEIEAEILLIEPKLDLAISTKLEDSGVIDNR